MKKPKLCYAIKLGGFSITLEQTKTQGFTVTYGKQIDRHLSYARAAQKLGEDIMHALACEGRLDDDQD